MKLKIKIRDKEKQKKKKINNEWRKIEKMRIVKKREITEGMGEKERKEQRDSDAKKKIFCLQRFEIYHLSLQEQKRY